MALGRIEKAFLLFAAIYALLAGGPLRHRESR
jgi:hypothetical protein